MIALLFLISSAQAADLCKIGLTRVAVAIAPGIETVRVRDAFMRFEWNPATKTLAVLDVRAPGGSQVVYLYSLMKRAHPEAKRVIFQDGSEKRL